MVQVVGLGVQMVVVGVPMGADVCRRLEIFAGVIATSMDPRFDGANEA